MGARKLVSVLCFAPLLACAPTTTDAEAPRVVDVAPAVGSPRVEPAVSPADDGALPLERQAARVVCADREPCSILKLRSAGDRGEEQLLVGYFRRGDETFGDDPPPPSENVLSSDGNSDIVSAEYGRCTKIEVWLLAKGRGPMTREHLLGEICNDGHGASGVGEDSLTVEPGSLTYSQYGGSSWRWGQSVSVTLSPLTVVKSTSDGHWNIAENRESSSFDYRTFSGETTWFAPKCDPNGSMPAGPGSGADPPPYAFVAIPQLPASSLPAPTELRAAALGACAASVDGATAGYGLSGRGTASARMRLLAVGATLHVEIEDDAFVDKGAKRDELELWSTPKLPGYSSHCIEPQSGPRGAAFPLADGPARKLGGATSTPTVERLPSLDGGKTRRLAITLPAGEEGLTVVYRDTDDGKKHDASMATSDFDAKDPTTLGRLFPVAPERARCVVVSGALEPRLSPVLRDTPIF